MIWISVGRVLPPDSVADDQPAAMVLEESEDRVLISVKVLPASFARPQQDAQADGHGADDARSDAE
ncbi:hypothetical protein [Microbacterium deminutum]|uniref:Uncharacterized protein n=1 Tax=Microbacterium deminutum TaxID=344164 RepID=A0ABP5CRH0_9MICO